MEALQAEFDCFRDKGCDLTYTADGSMGVMQTGQKLPPPRVYSNRTDYRAGEKNRCTHKVKHVIFCVIRLPCFRSIVEGGRLLSLNDLRDFQIQKNGIMHLIKCMRRSITDRCTLVVYNEDIGVQQFAG